MLILLVAFLSGCAADVDEIVIVRNEGLGIEYDHRVDIRAKLSPNILEIEWVSGDSVSERLSLMYVADRELPFSAAYKWLGKFASDMYRGKVEIQD